MSKEKESFPAPYLKNTQLLLPLFNMIELSILLTLEFLTSNENFGSPYSLSPGKLLRVRSCSDVIARILLTSMEFSKALIAPSLFTFFTSKWLTIVANKGSLAPFGKTFITEPAVCQTYRESFLMT